LVFGDIIRKRLLPLSRLLEVRNCVRRLTILVTVAGHLGILTEQIGIVVAKHCLRLFVLSVAEIDAALL
jgi:hypothetical protein